MKTVPLFSGWNAAVLLWMVATKLNVGGYLLRGIESFQGFLGGANEFRLSTVMIRLSCVPSNACCVLSKNETEKRAELNAESFDCPLISLEMGDLWIHLACKSCLWLHVVCLFSVCKPASAGARVCFVCLCVCFVHGTLGLGLYRTNRVCPY